MADTPKLKVGDPVRVFDVNGRRMGMPSDGWPGTVVKVGRALVTIEHPGSRGQVFRLDGQRSNDGYAHQSFKTLEQAADDVRRGAALESLTAAGIGFARVRDRDYTTDQIEALAALVSTFTKKES